ncbi:MAG: hypothetical protein QGI09_07660, partial [Dehalococcoidia bacterium]|nr:hypothetical protein [Dehalococcoidia bacterium]
VAELSVGIRYFLRFAQEVGAITSDEAEALWRRCWAALSKVALAQSWHQDTSEPTGRFAELLLAAIASGHAHVAGRDGGEPPNPGVCGWMQVKVGTGGFERSEWRPEGDRVGWVDGEDLFLEPNASYAAAQQLASRGGDAIAVRPKTLHKRLHERGILAAVDEGRNTLTVRRSLGGGRRSVLHLHLAFLIPQEPAQPDHHLGDPDTERHLDWSGSRADSTVQDRKTAQNNCPAKGQIVAGNGVPGQIGQIVDPKDERYLSEATATGAQASPAVGLGEDPWEAFHTEVGDATERES